MVTIRDNCPRCGVKLNKYIECDEGYCIYCFTAMGFNVEDVE